mgnify:CR=1 FL=1
MIASLAGAAAAVRGAVVTVGEVVVTAGLQPRGDRDDAVLERLSEYFQGATIEFRQFIKEQDSFLNICEP